jgi:hypothetical protein
MDQLEKLDVNDENSARESETIEELILELHRISKQNNGVIP